MRHLPIAFALVLSACDGGEDTDQNIDANAPTYHQDIHPLLSERCTSCHTTGGLNPNTLFDDGEVTQGWANLIAAQTSAGLMPPFKATEEECDNPWGFKHDPRLTSEELDLIQRWANAGGPIGDPENAAALPAPPTSELPNATATFYPAGPYTTVGSDEIEDEFACLTIDPGLTQAKWLDGLQVAPDKLEIVHHVLIGIDLDGASAGLADSNGTYPCFGGFGISNVVFVGGWIPGGAAIEMPDFSAVRVPAGARLVMQMHYNNLPEPKADRSGLSVRWSDQTPVSEAIFSLQGNSSTAAAGLLPGESDNGSPRFFIPANAEGHVESMALDNFGGLPRSLEVFLIANHMHYVGDDMKVWFERTGDGSNSRYPDDDVCVLRTPQWEFNWQQFYGYDLAAGGGPVLDPGDTIRVECSFDNTLGNPGVADALDKAGLSQPIDVGIGEGSLDEMCLALIGTVPVIHDEVDNQTHTGMVNLSVTAPALGIDDDCDGPIGVSVADGNFTAQAVCGLDLTTIVATVEMAFTGTVAGDGTASGTVDLSVVGAPNVDLSGTWSGTVDDSAADLTVSITQGGVVLTGIGHAEP